MESAKYQAFCLAGPDFFDSPARMADDDSRFGHSVRPVPSGWRRHEYGLWSVMTPNGVELPAQGWKIHLSASLQTAPDVVGRAWDYCLGQALPFKFLRSRAAVAALNAKEASRASSGKLVTIYPPDERRLAVALSELAALLSDCPGPYVLSDLRYGSGPVYVRYGAFKELYCTGDDGEPTPALHTPDGTLVPDRRGPVFSVPGWVSIPDVLRPSVAARQSGGRFPFEIRRALQFSNSGGVYLATDQATGEPVVLREARPYAGLDRDGQDAFARLSRERAVRARLSDLDCVPRLLRRMTIWEHEFLVEEYVEGETLLTAVIQRHPLAHPEPTRAELDAYRDWAVDVLARVERAVAAVHARGIRYGDLHPGNIIVRPDGRVALLDFELAADLDAPGGAGMGAPGFAAPAGLRGAEIDQYALQALRLFVFMPLAQMLARDRAKADTLAAAAARFFPHAPGFGALLLTKAPDPAATLFDEPLDWSAIRASLVAAIHASATPDRSDRLFPGDPNQFVTGGMALRSGAAGVLYALHQAGEDVRPEYLDWLRATARRGRRYLRGGCYDGLHGVALVLDLLGDTATAVELLALAQSEVDDVTAVGLVSGGSGIGLTLLHFADRTGNREYRATVERIAGELAAMLRGEASGLRPPARPGLMRGMTGPALLFLHLYEHTGDAALLDLAERALRRDLDRSVLAVDGTRQVLDEGRHLAYLADGTAGLALVLQRFLRYQDRPDLTGALDEIRRACWPAYVFQPGLFNGRAGLLAALAHLGIPADRPVIRDHVRRLAWHALSYRGHLAFPGTSLMRLSMDLATGSAGVLLALCAAFDENRAVLPFLAVEGTGADARFAPRGGDLHVVRA